MDGKATVVANGIAAEVEGCVAALANGWRFPIPTDRKPVDASASFTFPATGKQPVVPCNPIKDHVVDPFAKSPCPS